MRSFTRVFFIIIIVHVFFPGLVATHQKYSELAAWLLIPEFMLLSKRIDASIGFWDPFYKWEFRFIFDKH